MLSHLPTVPMTIICKLPILQTGQWRHLATSRAVFFSHQENTVGPVWKTFQINLMVQWRVCQHMQNVRFYFLELLCKFFNHETTEEFKVNLGVCPQGQEINLRYRFSEKMKTFVYNSLLWWQSSSVCCWVAEKIDPQRWEDVYVNTHYQFKEAAAMCFCFFPVDVPLSTKQFLFFFLLLSGVPGCFIVSHWYCSRTKTVSWSKIRSCRYCGKTEPKHAHYLRPLYTYVKCTKMKW